MHLFTLIVQSSNSDATATLFEHPFSANDTHTPLKALESVTGLPLKCLHDDVLEALRANQHKPATLFQSKMVELKLNEVSGIRLAVLFKATASLSTVKTIRAMRKGIATMCDEEVYYWFAKCYYSNYAARATEALRILHGVESDNEGHDENL